MRSCVYLLFLIIFVVVLCFEIDFCTSDHMNCDVPEDDYNYTDVFCMARTENLRTPNAGAYLQNYGRWQFFIIVQMFLAAVACRLHLQMNKLQSDNKLTMGKEYILTVFMMVIIIACWALTNMSMGGYFSTFGLKVLYHAVDARAVPSPIVTMFPQEAQCLVESPLAYNTSITLCQLPLNAKTPYYFLALWLAYSLCLLCVTGCILKLAWAKMVSTCPRKDQELCCEDGDSGDVKATGLKLKSLDEILRKISESVKSLALRSSTQKHVLLPTREIA